MIRYKLLKKHKLFILDIIVVLLMFFLFHNTSFAKDNCQRPKHWNYIYNKEIDCVMDIRHYLLYTHSLYNTKIERRNTHCIVVKGLWDVVKYNKTILTDNPRNIHIDHILPFSWIKKQIDCKDIEKAYNYIYNLELADATYNMKKSDKICEDKIICIKQKDICKKMNKDLNLSLKCSEL